MTQVTMHLPAPQQWCGQTQPHYSHTWVNTQGLYASCAGHSGQVSTSRATIREDSLDVRRMLDDIRKRDKETVPRLGNPSKDPLLRAEMDRRYLLQLIESWGVVWQ